MAKKEIVRICNLIDWSKSFVDENGSFYSGTTDEQKYNAAKIIRQSEFVIATMDLHPVTAPEHAINGGLYPVHNAVNPWEYGPDFIYMITKKGEKLRLGNKTLSPELTGILHEAASSSKKNKGLLVPREVYFQGINQSVFCLPADVETTFKEKIITMRQYLDGDYDYITAPKQFFDATRLDSDIMLPGVVIEGVPSHNFNIYSLLKMKFPPDRFELIFINTGVVEGICRLHTSIGLRQMFPFDRIINISDATTPLYGVGLGYETPEESRRASMRVCKDIGIEYMSTEECLDTFKSGHSSR
ncbi:MAG: hypothetical protein MUF15_14000 [Acidobacteria bacterium]|jgi:hypothetical protein|nr:hypothetical protein [Acidobacteriota bacterium]